ncbi:MAG: hypothetical protein CM1200mP5_4940 [Candidatus Pelagibacterales bacterium]|nr:MAG: hypothetical protein CM1200mP5_4940 [Pelagibacterales bacterium]
MAPDYYCMDGSIPRGKLAEALKEINELSKKYNLPVANCFHAVMEIYTPFKFCLMETKKRN